MKKAKSIVAVMAIVIAMACQGKAKNGMALGGVSSPIAKEIALPQDLGKYETAYFASGCFWCVEAIFESVKGVPEVISGYAGGTEKNPTYEQVGGGLSNHAEAVKVYYDPKIISFTELVQVFFGSHDPTSLNRQGPDRGRQYRSIAFYKTEQEKQIIDAYIKALTEQNVYDGEPITTEVTPFTTFYDAEGYHQDYEKKHPDNSYIVNVSIPRLNKFKANFKTFLKEGLH